MKKGSRSDSGLKDIFKTVLNDKGGSPHPQLPQIIIHGNGNVIAPGGTVHMIHTGDGTITSTVTAPDPQEQ